MSSARTSGSPYVKLEQGFYGPLPQIRSWCLEGSEGYVSLLVKRRALNDYVVVAKRVSTEGVSEVAFGTGFDFIGALLGLEGSLAADRWRPDKPYQPGQ